MQRLTVQALSTSKKTLKSPKCHCSQAKYASPPSDASRGDRSGQGRRRSNGRGSQSSSSRTGTMTNPAIFVALAIAPKKPARPH